MPGRDGHLAGIHAHGVETVFTGLRAKRGNLFAAGIGRQQGVIDGLRQCGGVE